MKRTFRSSALLITLALISTVITYAQQDKGDKEIGLAGAATFSHSSPVNGNATVQGSLGYYFTQHQFVGITAGPSLQFGGGSTTGSVQYGGEYRYLLGQKNSKIWPFIGGTIGAETSISKNGNSTTATTFGQAAPEFGLKFYASQKTSFELSYLLEINLSGQAAGAGFGQRSSSLILLGFKHIF
jgi:hypothetical protein